MEKHSPKAETEIVFYFSKHPEASVKEIAQNTGYSSCTIYNYIGEEIIKRREEKQEKLYREIEETVKIPGMSAYETAKKCGCTINSVYEAVGHNYFKKKRKSESRIEKYVDEHPDMPVKEMARNLHIHPTTIYKAVDIPGKRGMRVGTLTKRKFEIFSYKQSHPELSLREVGKHFGVSRQYIYQVCKEARSCVSLAG